MNKMYNHPRLFLAYMLGYLLLMEWLLPLPSITDIGYIPIFMGVTAFFFIVMFFGIPWWAILPLITTGILFSIHIIFFESPFLSAEWWGLLLEDVNQNIGYFVSGQWYGLSDLFRSVLFLLLLAIMSYLIYFWVIHARRILFFFVFTVSYLAVMDTFFPYDGHFAIARVFIIGFLLLAFLQWDRLSMFFDRKRGWEGWTAWILASLSLLIIAAGAGIAAPKAEPQWPDPVPYLKTAAGLENNTQLNGDETRVIGYGDNDEKLGGGFAMDDTPVFTATGESGGYWRGESKNVYTGHGWKSNTPHESMDSSEFYHSSVPQTEKEIEVNMKGNFDFQFAFYPGELRSLETEEKDIKTEINRHSGKASMFINGTGYQPQSYRVLYNDPEFPIEKMRQVPKEDPEYIQKYYLSLPENLPSSVKELAEDITADKENRYDKVRAVESYFHGPEFTYDTRDIPVPEEGEDYVAQFLFETRRGYCDNFSTSMVVMLRSLDIPARWVKGFTEGEKIGTNNGIPTYEVTNANAHSWVEVYFPEVGWVPFEPTKGFNADFINYESGIAANEEEPEKEEDVDKNTDDEEQKEEEEDTAVGNFQWSDGSLMIGAALTLILIFLLFSYRMRIFKRIILFRFKQVGGYEDYTKAFHTLLWFLQQAGYRKAASETLREFAARIDHAFETTDMSVLTREYEKIHYGNQKSSVSQVIPIWESMVERIKA